MASILAGPAAQPGVKAIHGSMVLELAISEASKAAAISRLRYETGATGVVFLGDDPSDEEAIRSLGAQDLGIRVGATETRALGRTPDIQGVTAALELLLELRRGWLTRRTLVPIEQLSILSDQRTVAVVDPRGARGVELRARVWIPRPSSPSFSAGRQRGPSRSRPPQRRGAAPAAL